MATPATLQRKLSAQGSCTVRVLKTGDNIFLSLKSDKGLAQGWNATTQTCVPDWSKAAEQPTITPEVTSANGAPVALKNHQWKYNGILLTFDTSTKKSTNTGYAGWFEINPTATTCTLKILHNLASATNLGSSTIEYLCTAVSEGMEYDMNKSIDIIIQQLGDSGFMASLTTNTTQLSSATDRQTTTLYPRLFTGGGDVAENAYWVQYYKDDTPWGNPMLGSNHPIVTRNDVDGEQLFIAYFFNSNSDFALSKAVAQAAIRITDTADSYRMVTEITSANKEVAPNKSVTVTSKVIKISDGTQVTLNNPVWISRVYAKNNFITPIKQNNTNTIDVTYADTLTSSGSHEDVEVVAEVEWGLAIATPTTPSISTNVAISHPMDKFGFINANAVAFSKV